MIPADDSILLITDKQKRPLVRPLPFRGRFYQPHKEKAGALPLHAGALMERIAAGEKLYTGYTKEYIRAFAFSREDIRGQIINGKLTVESLPLFEYT